MRAVAIAIAFISVAADFASVDPNVFPKDDPRAKDLPRMMQIDAKRRMQEANLRETQAFAAVTTKPQWEAHRDARIKALREALGTFPEAPKDMRIVVTGTIEGEGFTIRNIVYETRPDFWVSANLYLPAKPQAGMHAKMPGLILSHSHHNPKTEGELQDMGMTWARAGCVVLVPDHLGHGERRQHDFRSEKDYPKPFRVGRQDYYFRYNSNLQLSLVGDSLMGWMAWDLMRGVDVLLKQPGIDKDRIILLGAVAGGGDPAGVTAALDARITCVVPFNFGGWQPESSVLENPDRDFAWFGDGYWESTRGLKGGAAGGFAHYVITGSIAPRPLIHAHEFAWDAKTDPSWPRLQKIYGFYDAKDRLSFAHGAGTVRQSGPGNTHCNNIGAVHRTMIYPALKQWFDMPVPEEYRQRRMTSELLCWTEAAKTELKPKKLHEVLKDLAKERENAFRQSIEDVKDRRARFRQEWTRLLGNITPVENPKVIAGAVEDVPNGKLARFALETDPGIVVPLLLIAPKGGVGKSPVVVMVAQGGKAAFLKERGDAIAAFLKAGVTVCLPDVRGTGETRIGASGERGSSRTSISQTNLILGQPVLGAQVRDLGTVVTWLRARPDVDAKRVALWGDSFAPMNRAGDELAVPLDAPNPPAIAEPGGTLLVGLVMWSLAEPSPVVYARGGLSEISTALDSPYLAIPHEAVVPGVLVLGRYSTGGAIHGRFEGEVDCRNRPVEGKPGTPVRAAEWVIDSLKQL